MRYLLEQSGLFLPKLHEHWPVAVSQIPFPLQSFGQDKSGTEYRGSLPNATIGSGKKSH